MQSETSLSPSAMSGRILVAGCGLIVTGAAWALFGFVQHLQAAAGLAIVFFVLSGLHVAVGAFTLNRQRGVWNIAILVGTVGFILALSELQYVLMTTNLVTTLLLVLARADIIAGSASETQQPDRDARRS